jgi:hypothetical protein
VTVDGKVIHATDGHPFWVEGRDEWVDAGDLQVGDVLLTEDGTTATVDAVRAYTMVGRVFNLTVQGLHTYYAGAELVLVHNAARACGSDDDPARRRPTLRVGTKEEVRKNAPKTSDGDYIDPNTQKTIPKDGPFHYGHKTGREWWRTRDRARNERWTRERVIEHENNPDIFHIEDPIENMKHTHEKPRGKKKR